MTDLVDMIKNRIAQSSNEDRYYGRPMSWDEAEKLLDIIVKLQAEVKQYQAAVEEKEAFERWEGYVDRQSGAFTDQEIADCYRWR